MSLLAVQGGATGTGTVTLLAPVTNSDRTVTLPDQTATLITDSAAILNIGSGQFYKDASGNVGIGTSSPTAKLTIDKSSDSASPSRTPADYSIRMTAASSNTYNGGVCVSESTFVNAAITPIDTGSGGAQGWAFITGNNTAIAEAARIDSSGNLLAGGATAAFDAADSSNSSGQGVNISKSVYRPLQAYAENGTVAAFKRNGNNGGVIVFARGSVGEVGSISVNTTATTYATSSDYRLKNTIAPMTGALAKVALLKPCTYKWNLDGSDGQGFIAHELDEVVPQCVSGEKDAVEEQQYEVTPAIKDEEGNTVTEAVMGTRTVPKYQGIDTSFLVATLTAAIQELKAIVDAQGAEIAALKGAA